MSIFLTRLCFPSKLSVPEVIRKRYGDRIFKLVRKFAKIDIKNKQALLDLQFLKFCEDYVIPKLLILLYVSLTYKRCQKKLLLEEICNKKLIVSQLDRDSKLLHKNVKSTINVIDFHHVLNISLMSNEKELE